MLPCPIDIFRDKSVLAVGSEWRARFDVLLKRATSVETLDLAPEPTAVAISTGESVALGMALNKSRQLHTSARELRIDGESDIRRRAVSGRSSIISTKRDPGVEQRGLDNTQLAAIVQTLKGREAYPSIEEAWATIRQNQTKAALDLNATDGAAVSQIENDRLAAMHDCAEDGQIVATRDAAFALLASDEAIRIESAGEMRWAGGRMPLYLVS